MARASDTAAKAASRVANIQADEDSPSAVWRRRLETASNLVCQGPGDLVSTVSVLLPLSGEPGEAERLEAIASYLAAERELDYSAKVGARSITITYSNRV